ncbi:MAG TPA: MFS transporter [Actinomycetota bacterium]|jgi:MFS family permease|nr:MFS transporter [Actinomycetota bacterium]
MTPISTFIPNLPRRAWIVLAGDAFSAFGSGLVLPFLVVYLRDVRGFSVDTAGLVVSTMAVVGLAGGPGAGWIVDRVGSRRGLILSQVLCALGAIAIAAIGSTWQAFAASALFGAGLMILWPASHSLLSSMVPAKQRSSVFSVHYMTLNAGIGVGGITGGLVADVDRAFTFELLYVFDALTFLGFATVLFLLKDVGARHEPENDVDLGPGGYGEVLRDRLFLRICALGILLVAVGYSQLESGFPAYATAEGGISTRMLGITFAVNTAVIVVGQLIVLKKLAGRRRSRALAVMGGLWAVAWLVTLGAGNAGGALLPAVGFMVAMAFFALGETFMSPTLPAIVNDLAPDHLRGRYNALYSMSWSAGHIIGPAVAGVALERGLGDHLFAGLVVVCLLAARAGLRLERHLPAAANLVDPGDAAPGAEEKTPSPTSSG